MSSPGADAFGRGASRIRGPDGDGRADVGVGGAVFGGDDPIAIKINGHVEDGIGALQVTGGCYDPRGVREFCRNLEEDNPALVDRTVRGGHEFEESRIGGEGGRVGGPGAVLGVPGENRSADGLGDRRNLGFFGRFEGPVDGRDREPCEEADDGDHHQELDEGERRPARSAGWIRMRIRLKTQRAGGGRREAGSVLDFEFWIHGRSRTFLGARVKEAEGVVRLRLR